MESMLRSHTSYEQVFTLLYIYLSFVGICLSIYGGWSAYVEVREQLLGASSLIPPCGFKRQNSGQQT